MDNFIGRKELGNNRISFDAYWVIHGTPLGHKYNVSETDPNEYIRYVSDFHSDKGLIQPWPSIPGETFIKKKLKDGVAYTFLRTGIYEYSSTRPGSNYGAVTVIMDDMDESYTKKFEQDLKTWFEKNILAKFTYTYGDDWLRWDEQATRLFHGDYDKQLKDSLQSVLKPYLSNQNIDSNQKGSNRGKTDKFNEASQKLREEIARLEQEKKNIEKQLAEKYAQLENM